MALARRSNIELAAQAIANLVSTLFGGTSVAGTTRSPATYIRGGAVTSARP